MISLITEDINGNRLNLDLNQDLPIALNKSFLELTDIEKRKGDFSMSFALPRTPANDAFFGLFGDPSSFGQQWTPRVDTKAWLLEDTDIIIEGSLRLESTDLNNSRYTCSISGAVFTIKNAIGDKSMSDIDMSDWLYTASDIHSTWDGSLFGGDMIFSIHDFGFGYGLYKKVDTGNELVDTVGDNTCQNVMVLEKTLPCFRLNELLRRMFSGVNLNLAGSWFSEPEAEEIYVQSDNPLSSFFATPTSWNTKMGEDLEINQNLQTIPLIGNPSFAEWDDILHEYTAPVDGTYQFRWSVQLQRGNPVTVNLTLEFQINTVAYAPATAVWQWNTGNAAWPENIPMLAGDVLRMRIKDDNTSTTNGNILVTDNTYLELTNITPTGTDQDPSEHLANYKQKDFLREIIGIFNLIVWMPNTQDVRIDTWDYYMANYGSKKDWTDKVDLSKTPVIKPINGELRNPIVLSYKEAPDVLNQEYVKVIGRPYGSYREDTRIPFTQPPAEPFKIFAPIPTQELLSDVPTAQNLLMVIGRWWVSEDDLSFKAPGLQLAYYNGERSLIGTGTNFYYQVTQGSGCALGVRYPYFSAFRLYEVDTWQVQDDTLDLNFAWMTPPADIVDDPTEQNLFTRYFANMLRERYDENNKIVELSFILDGVDIANFSFADTILVTLNGTPVGLKILEIKDYSPNVKKSTRVKAMITFIR